MHWAAALRRVGAFSIDWLLIAAWGGTLFSVVLYLSDGEPPEGANPWIGQLVGFVSMTLPVLLYFTLCECSSFQATLGKRCLGLSVTSVDFGRLNFQHSLLRNALKFLPWELGHLGAQQMFFAGEAEPATWIWLPLLASMIIPVLWFLHLLRMGDTPYDGWAGARVVKQSKP